MSDKPTYREYARNRIGNVVRTVDGRFFFNRNFRVINGLRYGSSCLFVIVSAIPGMIGAKRGLPPSVWGSVLALLLMLYIPVERFFYRISRYEEIPEDSEDYAAAFEGFAKRDKKSRRIARLLSYIIACMIFLVFVTNSYPAFYIRNALEGSSVVVQTEAYYGEIAATILPISAEADRVVVPKAGLPSLMVTVNGLLLKIQAFVDGKPMTQGLYWWNRGGFIWDENYATSVYSILLDREEIEDGSVLEITCGNWRHQWVFTLEPENE